MNEEGTSVNVQKFTSLQVSQCVKSVEIKVIVKGVITIVNIVIPSHKTITNQ